mmetsp:Transcript_11058/g.19999  ORF Transcript_11058/g.19999 Transcript_11058/m.19999 type:complete len:80 (-) Transcript_11058:221-460(-)
MCGGCNACDGVRFGVKRDCSFVGKGEGWYVVVRLDTVGGFVVGERDGLSAEDEFKSVGVFLKERGVDVEANGRLIKSEC